MKVKRFLNYITFGGNKPDSISELRWRGMKAWYETRNKENDWLDADYR